MRVISRENHLVACPQQFLRHDTIILSDLDGTVLPLIHDPAQRFIDAGVRDAWLRFNDIAPDQVIPITGRDWEQVVQCFQHKQPTFPVISSNGAQLHVPSQKEITHSFTLPEQVFLREMHESMQAFQKEHPQLVTERKRFEIGFHSEPTAGHGHCPRDLILNLASKCEAMLEHLEADAKRKGLNFSVASTEVTAQEMSHRGIDKLQAVLSFFTAYLPPALQGNDWSNVIYFGDSLLKGNDRVIAIAVKERGGLVGQVINGVPDRIPPEDDAARPHFVFNDPAALGSVLSRQVNRIEMMPRRAFGD